MSQAVTRISAQGFVVQRQFVGCRHRLAHVPLSTFKEKQTIVAQLVAKYELQANGEARQRFDQFPLHVVCSFEAACACVKPCAAASRTGIKSKAFLRMLYKPKAFQRALASFPLETVADREQLQPQDIDQMAEASVLNLCSSCRVDTCMCT